MPDAAPRDDTQDWLVGEDLRPPSFGELVDRVDEALDVAHASEAAVETIGTAAAAAASRARDALRRANEAAEHARRSAEIAEQAGASALEARDSVRESARRLPPLTFAGQPPEDPSLRKFSDRADRVVARLRALQRIPLTGRDRARVP